MSTLHCLFDRIIFGFLASSISDIDALLHQVLEDGNALAYIILSPEGIPVKFHEVIQYQNVITYANLVSEFAQRAGVSLEALFGNEGDAELLSFRLRMKAGNEIVTTVCNEFLLVVIQKCSVKL